jgi:uncharacterized protein (DUF4415 family)
MKRKKTTNKQTLRQRAAWKKLVALPDSKIDTSDIPETIFSRKAQRGLFYQPRKASVTIRLDEDLLAYYKAQAQDGRYQTEINRVLREHMTQAE